MGLPLESPQCISRKEFFACGCTRCVNLTILANPMIVESSMESDGALTLTVMATTLTSSEAAEFRETARSAIEGASGRVVVDCSQLEFVDSSGVGALLHVNNLLPEARRPVCLANVGPKVLATLELMRVHRQFELQPRP